MTDRHVGRQRKTKSEHEPELHTHKNAERLKDRIKVSTEKVTQNFAMSNSRLRNDGEKMK